MRCPPLVASASLLALGLVAGCAPAPKQVAWSIELSDPALRDATTNVSAWILENGCNGNRRLYEIDLAGTSTGPDPRALPQGVYGFAAEARDAACRPIASGCVERRLPRETDMEIAIVLEAQSAPPRCPPGQCRLGVCSVDGGVSDGGMSDGGLDDCDGVRRPGGACYREEASPLGIAAAKSACGAWGGALLLVDDAAEGGFLVATFAPGADPWIDLDDVAVEGTWVTHLGTPASYLPWASGEPDNAMNKDCARLRLGSAQLEAARCADVSRTICERP